MAEAMQKAGRGRPRKFDKAEALHKAQALFHRHGYEGVSLSDLTAEMGITPPSFYAAFQSKADLFGMALQRYSSEDGIPFAQILTPGRDVALALGDLLAEAAKRYSATPEAPGCLVLYGRSALEPEAQRAACALQGAAMEVIRAFVGESRPEAADRVTQYIAVVMAGLSAEARTGVSPAALVQAAEDAALALPALLASRE